MPPCYCLVLLPSCRMLRHMASTGVLLRCMLLYRLVLGAAVVPVPVGAPVDVVVTPRRGNAVHHNAWLHAVNASIPSVALPTTVVHAASLAELRAQCGGGGGSPSSTLVVVTADVTVPIGEPLSIVGGVHLHFAAGAGIMCHGSLLINGTPLSPVIVTYVPSWWGVRCIGCTLSTQHAVFAVAPRTHDGGDVVSAPAPPPVLSAEASSKALLCTFASLCLVPVVPGLTFCTSVLMQRHAPSCATVVQASWSLQVSRRWWACSFTNHPEVWSSPAATCPSWTPQSSVRLRTVWQS